MINSSYLIRLSIRLGSETQYGALCISGLNGRSISKTFEILPTNMKTSSLVIKCASLMMCVSINEIIVHTWNNNNLHLLGQVQPTEVYRHIKHVQIPTLVYLNNNFLNTHVFPYSRLYSLYHTHLILDQKWKSSMR